MSLIRLRLLHENTHEAAQAFRVSTISIPRADLNIIRRLPSSALLAQDDAILYSTGATAASRATALRQRDRQSRARAALIYLLALDAIAFAIWPLIPQQEAALASIAALFYALPMA